MIVEEAEPIGKEQDHYAKRGRGNHPKAAKEGTDSARYDRNLLPYSIMVDCRHPYGLYGSECIHETNVYKEKRAWLLSHEAFLTLQELAHHKGTNRSIFRSHQP